MASISFSALVVLLLFLTPAIPFWIVFRASFPKGRSVVGNEPSLILFGVFLGWFTNGHHICAFFGNFLRTLPDSGKDWLKDAPFLLALLPKIEVPAGGVVSKFISWLFWWHGANETFIGFVFQLHLRSLVFAWFAVVVVQSMAIFERKMQLVPYRPGFPKSLTVWDYLQLFLFGIKPHDVERAEFYERVVIRLKALKWVQDLILHPWSNLTLRNPKREVLMADVYTVDDNLYSGALVTWAPDGDSISSIALEYVLRFKSQVGNNGRRKEFIKNNGHLVILANQIRTVHFWELRNGTTARVSIFEPGDIERLKWNIVLSAIYPDFMTSIQAILWLQDKDLRDFSEELSRWADDHGLTSHMRSIRVLRGTKATR